MSDFSQFEQYYKDHMPKLYRYVYSRTGSDCARAEDLVSEIFLKALEHFDQYRTEFPFGAWLFGIARNHLIDHYKKHAKTATTSLEDLENVLSTGENIQKQTDLTLSTDQLQKALKELPEEKQELVTLRYISGYSYSEIGKMLGKEENTVKVAAFRVVQQLKEKMQSYSSSHDTVSPESET